MTIIAKCRFCASSDLSTFIDLGETALANSYVKPESLQLQDKAYSLHARVCHECFLVQVDDVVLPSEIFSDYAYFSSVSSSWVEHAKRYANKMKQRLDLTNQSLVIEVASNDGYLLQHFVEMDIPVLGIEPAANVAKEALAKGVPTEVMFFGKQVAIELLNKHGRADLMTANNVLAHAPDINDFVSGFKELLALQGVATFEFPHLLKLMKHVQFDTIYHEHFSYLSLCAVEKCFTQHKLRIFDVEELSSHGGSLRVWACHESANYESCPGLDKIRQDEECGGIKSLKSYSGFAKKVAKIRDDLLSFLKSATKDGKKVAAYGAAAKGNTLLNFAGITSDMILYVVDANPHKQNMLMPGSRIPIVAPSELGKRKPDYILILPWNLQREITASIAYSRDWGAKFVVAFPDLEIF